MSWNLLRLDEVAAAPWRNGGGVTRELLAWPDAGAWRVRMSVAQVERDGPFSRFDGVQRWFAVLDGAGVRLRIHGATHELTQRSAPLQFDGGMATDCTLIAGPTQDFNLMLRGAEGRMGRVRGTHPLDCSAMQLIAIYAGPGAARATFGDDRVEIGPRTLAWRILEADGPLRIDSPDALWMEIKP
jgi:environmental stress-induced protein Ves